MYTTGLVVTFVDDPEQAGASLGELTAAGPFTIGDSCAGCRPIVLETPDPKTAHDWHEWAAALPGIASVEVVFVHWDDVQDDVQPEVSHVGA